MLTRAAERVTTHAKGLLSLELQLAALELKRKVTALAIGIVMLVAAGIFGLFGLGFALSAIAAALENVLPTWLALLIVGGGLILLSGLLALLGLGRLRKGTPPIPEQALAEAKLTSEALKNGHH
jgi:putative superfamily III holin-X